MGVLTSAIHDGILARIGKGESLVSILRDDKMPDYSTFMRWLASDETLREKYARAREDQAEFLAQQIIEISDEGTNDTYLDENGNRRTDYDVIARSRLRVDARKWIASKLLPKKYGEKPDEVHVSTHLHNHISLDRQKEIQARMAAALQR